MALLSLQRPMWVSIPRAARYQHASCFLVGKDPHRRLLLETRRWASVKAQGAYRLKPKRTHPKKYGAKKTGDQYVIPGNIIWTQKGTRWWPGENTYMGRDHTIHAAVSGFVKFYKDPHVHPDRQYIGVTFRKEDKLPYPQHAVRKRKLNMYPQQISVPKHEPAPGELGPSGIPERILQRIKTSRKENRLLNLQSDYSYRESNYAIGRLVGPLEKIRKKAHRSRRLALRLRRAKKERRHMRLRTRIRKIRRDRDNFRLEPLLKKVVLDRRRASRNAARKYKTIVKTGVSAKMARQIAGPKVALGYDPIHFAKVRLLRGDGYPAKNRGAATKKLPLPKLWEENNLEKTAKEVVEKREKKRAAWRKKTAARVIARLAPKGATLQGPNEAVPHKGPE